MKKYPRVRELRLEYKLTQTELALEIGIEQSAYSKCERGINEFSVGAMSRIARHFHTTVDDLIGDTDQGGESSMVFYKPVYSFEEAAELLKIPESILHRYLKENKLRFIMLETRQLIRGIDLEAFINSRTSL